MKRIFRRSDEARDVGDELRFHLDMRAREFMEAGMSPEDARKAAADVFGDLGAVDAQLRVARGIHVRSRARRAWRQELIADVAFALRTLRKNIGFTAAALATLTLGIGAATAVFTVVDGVLLRPLPYADPSRLAMIWLTQPKSENGGDIPLSTGFYAEAVGAGKDVFSSIAAFRSWPYTLTGAGEPEQISGTRVTPTLFTILGVRPKLGRDFAETDGDSGAAPVAILSYSLWQRRFGGDAAIVGRSIDLSGQSFTIIGVMPAGFAFPRGAELPKGLQFGLRSEIWTPYQLTAADRRRYSPMNTSAIGRLKPGVTLARAQGELSAALQAWIKERSPTLVLDYRMPTLKQQAGQSVRRGLFLLMGAVGFLLFIACANVANLLIARTGARRREFAVRATLGAGRGRIVRQLVTENVLLATTGSILGVAASVWATRAMLGLVPGSLPRADDVGVDWRVALTAAALAVVVGAIFGLAAGTQVRSGDLADSLRDGEARTTSGRARRIGRRSLVVAEVALSLMLIIGASLLATSFARLQRADSGIRADGTLTANIVLPIGTRFDVANDGPGWAAFFRQLTEQLAKAPQVEAAGAVSNLPLSDAAEGGGFAIVGQPTPQSGQAPHTQYLVVEGDYFRAMGIRLISGRFFDATDNAGSARVLVVSREFARRHLGPSPLGQQIIPYFDFSQAPRTVVGIVDNVQYGSLDSPIEAQAYVPERQMNYPGLNVVLRTRGDPMALLPVLKREVHTLNATLAVSRPRLMSDVMSESLARRRFSMTLIGIFAAAALVLAMVGLYGVIALSVSQRHRELGVRVALGAQASDVLRLVLGEGLRITAAGVLVGLAGAFALSQLVTSLLYGVSATSPGIYTIATTIVVCVTLIASYIPATRAARVDPNVALRSE